MKENYQQVSKLLKPRLTKYIPWIPTKKQQAFLLLDCEEAFYGGAVFGGKSVALLMAALQYVDIPGYNAILLRDTYANLSKPEGLIPLAHEWLQQTDAKWGENYTYTFPSGATLSFGYLNGPLDHFNYQSAAYQFVGIDEVVNIRENQALYMFSRLRRKIGVNIPLRFRCASNPPTREQVARGSWVKSRYVDPKTRHPDVIFIPAWMEDNPYGDTKSYKEQSLSKLDPITRRQLEKGDWEIRVSGRMFKREWFKIKDSFPVADIEWIRFWDLAGTDIEERKRTKSDEPAYTAGALVGRNRVNGLIYIGDMQRDQLSPLGCEMLIRQTAQLDGQHIPVWMWQDPGQAGKSQISHYARNVLQGFAFRGRPATREKSVVWSPLASQAEAGNVYLVKGHWNEDFLEELELLPDGKFKDQADAAGGAYEILAGINTGATPRISVIGRSEGRDVRPEKPENLKPGEMVIPIYEGDDIVGYEVVGNRKRRGGISLPPNLRS